MVDSIWYRVYIREVVQSGSHILGGLGGGTTEGLPLGTTANQGPGRL